MDLLPDPHQRSALLESLSHIIETRGFEVFVRAPILEPTSTYFPDPWEPSARGVRALSLRLLAYAALEGVDARVELYSEDHDVGDGHHHGTAAWFAGIDDDGVCQFGADTRQLALGDSIVGVMCHEVAHAYREHYDLVGKYLRIEEEDTDITTVYLGFGILTTNNAYRFRKSGGMVGAMVSTQWSTSQTGYLSPQAMAFLLAAQVVARGLDARDVKRIASHLEPNQRDFFRASHKNLSVNADGLRITLGVPPQEVWPSERPLELPSLPRDARFVPGETGDDDDADDDDPLLPAAAPWNDGGTVFRVRRTRAARWAYWGIFLGAIGGGLASARTEGPGWKWVCSAMLVGFAAGLVLGARRRFDECSDSRCGASLPIDERTTCLRCGGTIRGVIHDANDRLEVEDALQRGRPVAIVVEELAMTRRHRAKKRTVALAVVVGAIALYMFSDSIPRPTDLHTLKQRAHESVTVRIAGDIVEVAEGQVLVSEENGTTLAAFSMSDGTDTLQVWYDQKATPLGVHKGAHVRLWGHYVPMNVRVEGVSTASDSRHFVATSLSIDD